MDFDRLFPWLVGAMCAAFVPLFVWGHKQHEEERARWLAFRAAHACRVVEYQPGYTTHGGGYVATAKGGGWVNTTSYTPARTAWRCDDSVTYWREGTPDE